MTIIAPLETTMGSEGSRIFIVTNLTRPAERVVRFYNRRGAAEQWIKEGKRALR